MGAWDIGSFSNDDAQDWLVDLQEEDDLGILEDAFAAVIEQKGQLPEATDSSIAIAAGEVLAALLGSPMADLPEDVVEWLPGKPKPAKELVLQALEALKIVVRESELRELWEETDEYSAWREEVEAHPSSALLQGSYRQGHFPGRSPCRSGGATSYSVIGTRRHQRS